MAVTRGTSAGSSGGGSTSATNAGSVRKSTVNISPLTKRGWVIARSMRAISSGVFTNPMALHPLFGCEADASPPGMRGVQRGRQRLELLQLRGAGERRVAQLRDLLVEVEPGLLPGRAEVVDVAADDGRRQLRLARLDL